MNKEQSLSVVVDALEDVKGIDIKVLEVGHLTDITENLIICSGASNRQVKALAENVLEKFREHDLRPLSAEGKDTGEWVLLDFGDFIVHLMLPDTREFYDLESLWDIAAERRET